MSRKIYFVALDSNDSGWYSVTETQGDKHQELASFVHERDARIFAEIKRLMALEDK